jgi:hypothetical protein
MGCYKDISHISWVRKETPLIKFVIFTSGNVKIDLKSQENERERVKVMLNHKLNGAARYAK